MIFSKPIPFLEAIALRKAKKILPTSAGSAELALLDVAIRERSMFSAKTTDAGYLARMDRVLTDLVDPVSSAGNMPGRKSARTAKEARAELRQHLASIGYVAPAGKEGSLEDLSSDRRLMLITEMNQMEAHGYGQFVMQNDPDLMDEIPCLELVRGHARKVERTDWPARFVRAGGTLYGGRMIARKDSNIWTNLNRFGRPYPPFDFGSGMVTREIFRHEAEELGAIKRSDIVKPQTRNLNDNVEASFPKGISNGLADALKEAFTVIAGKIVMEAAA